MNARRAAVRAALYAYPAEFRSQFGDQICADVDEDPTPVLYALFDMLKGGVTMRLDAVSSDLRYALRRLSRAPLFVAIVLLTFALGIGANIAMFSVLNAVILRPLPVSSPQSLVVLTSHDPQGNDFANVSLTDASDIRAQSRSFEAIAGILPQQRTLLLAGKPYATNGLAVTPNYFRILNIHTEMGRVLNANDARPGTHAVVISDEFWRKRLGGASDAIGRTIPLDGVQFRVVGIMRPGQMVVDTNSETVTTRDYLSALPEEGQADERGARIGGALARLAPGVSVDQAKSELRLITSRLARTYPKTDKGWSFSDKSLPDFILGGAVSSIWLLFAAVLGVLLIACANVGNMLAARWSSRDREVAIRRSLGASPSRIASQLLAETGLLATGGTGIGVLLAYAALGAMHPTIVRAMPFGTAISIDGTSLLFAVLLVVITTVLAGFSPLLAFRSTDLHSALKSAGRGGDASGRHRLRSILVVVEIALALALVIISGLMARTYVNVINTPLGIRTQGVVVSDLFQLPERYANTPAAQGIDDALLARVQALPGIESAALAWYYPQGGAAMESGAPVKGRTYEHNAPIAITNGVTGDYFKTLGIPVLKGRSFTNADTANSEPVAIVNDIFVKENLIGMNPLNARIGVDVGPNKRVWARIVGVVGSVKLDVQGGPGSGLLPTFYLPLVQRGQQIVSVIVHAPALQAATAGREMQTAFSAAVPMVPTPETSTIAQRILSDTVYVRFIAVLLGALAGIALLLALSGIFAVMSFSVTQRVREFGIRIALGATSGSILTDVLRRSLAITATGCLLGVIIAAVAAHAIASQISVSPFDPLTFVTVIALIVVSAALASLQPALRATRVEPMESLRYE